MSYTKAQQEYIDSVGGQAHQSAIDIIGSFERLADALKLATEVINNMQSDNAKLKAELEDKHAYLDTAVGKIKELEAELEEAQRGLVGLKQDYGVLALSVCANQEKADLWDNAQVRQYTTSCTMAPRDFLALVVDAVAAKAAGKAKG